jgi:ribulose-5-phosphate 4-epimerase/fuculose-1-phosphate aldolase
VHREVYRLTKHLAIVHAHPSHVVAASLNADEIIPKDTEGQCILVEAEKTNMVLDPVSGEELQKIVFEIFKTDPSSLVKLKEMVFK